MDKGYDIQAVYPLVKQFGFHPHIKSRKEEQTEKREEGKKARRWMVERIHSWLNRFRRILVRWEIRLDTFLSMLHFACGIVVWRSLLPSHLPPAL